jgi:hypothetical protein
LTITHSINSIKKPSKILLVSGSFGTASALLVVYNRLIERNFKVIVVSSSIASKLFKSHQVKCIDINDSFNYDIASKIVEKHCPNLIIVGAGGNNNIEKLFIDTARIFHIDSFALVDNWCLIAHRFMKDQHSSSTPYILPDVIGVPDANCRNQLLSDANFRNVKIMISGMPHVESTRKNVFNKTKNYKELLFTSSGISSGNIVITFFSAPVESTPLQKNNVGYTEESIITSLIESVINSPAAQKQKILLLIKPHPSFEYSGISLLIERFKCHNLSIRLIPNMENEDIFLLSNAVFGMTTTALYEAAICGKITYSLQIGLKVKSDYCNFFISNKYFDCIFKKKDLDNAILRILNRERIKVYSGNHVNKSDKIVPFLISQFDLCSY